MLIIFVGFRVSSMRRWQISFGKINCNFLGGFERLHDRNSGLLKWARFSEWYREWNRYQIWKVIVFFLYEPNYYQWLTEPKVWQDSIELRSYEEPYGSLVCMCVCECMHCSPFKLFHYRSISYVCSYEPLHRCVPHVTVVSDTCQTWMCSWHYFNMSCPASHFCCKWQQNKRVMT